MKKIHNDRPKFLPDGVLLPKMLAIIVMYKRAFSYPNKQTF